MSFVMFRPLISKLLGSGVRAALAALGGWLVANGFAQTGQIDSLLLELSPILVALVLSGLEKINTQATIEVARMAPVETTRAELTQDVKALTLPEKVEKAMTTADPPNQEGWSSIPEAPVRRQSSAEPQDDDDAA